MEPILLTSHPPCFAPNESCRSWILFPGKCLLLCRNNFAKILSCFAPFRSVYKTKTVVKQERLGVFIWRFLFFAFQFGCSEWRSIDHRNNWWNSEASHPNCSSGRESAVLLYMKLFTALLFDFVHRFHIEHNAPCSVPQILHNLCPRNDCNTQKKLKTIVMHFFFVWSGRVWGVSKVHYGLCENGEFEMKMQMKWLGYHGNWTEWRKMERICNDLSGHWYSEMRWIKPKVCIYSVESVSFEVKSKYPERQREEQLFCLLIFFLFVYLRFSCCLFGIFVCFCLLSLFSWFSVTCHGNLTVA